jgi:hypothetical protein
VLIAAHERLLRGRLLSDHGKIDLLAAYPELHAAVAGNRDCDPSVSHLAEVVARSRQRDPSADARFIERATQVLAPLLSASLVNPHPGNMVLRRAFALLPATYRSTVLTRIAAEPTLSQTHYLLVAWLYAGLEPDEVAAATEVWLSTHAARNLKTSFVIRAWLEAGGERVLVDRHFLAWINAFGVTKNASFVYLPWLTAGGSFESVEGNLLACIRAFGATERAALLYSPWLLMSGKRECVEGDVRTWIKAFGQTKLASYVYDAWLDAGGNLHEIEQDVLKWIETFSNIPRAGFVFYAWLDAKGSFDIISRQCIQWFNEYSKHNKPGIVLAAGLVLKYIARHRSLPNETLHAAIRWCARFATEENAIWRVTSLLRSYSGYPEGVAIVRAFLD